MFELSGGNADFPYTVSDYHMPIMPKNDDGSVDWESGIRTGAYKLEKFTPGVSPPSTATKTTTRRTGAGSTASSSIRSRMWRPHQRAAVGEIHYMDRCDLKTLDMLKSNPDFTVQEITGYGHYIYVMDVRASPSTTATSATPSSIR